VGWGGVGGGEDRKKRKQEKRTRGRGKEREGGREIGRVALALARERAGEQDLESIYFKQTITQEQHLGALRLQICEFREFAKLRICKIANFNI